MADSNVSVMADITEQIAADAEIGLDSQIAPESPVMPENGETPSPKITDQEVAALVLEGEAARHEIGEEPLELSAPFDIGEPISEPSDVVVSMEKIEELVKGCKASARATTKATEKEAAEAIPTPEQPPEKKAVHKGRPQKSGKVQKPEKASRPPKVAKEKTAPAKEEVSPPEPEQSSEPRESPHKGEPEQIVYLNLSELHPFNTFRKHPFEVRDDAEMLDTVKSVKEIGVQHPAIVRPRQDGGYEIISGHRRFKASELAGYTDMPCIIRHMDDFEAVKAMKDANKQRTEILPSEKARLLDLELEALKRQGARADLTSSQNGPKLEKGQRSNEVVAQNNNMTVKQVQRYIKLNELIPDLLKMVDEKKIAFTPAVELAFIKPKNQRYIAVAIEGQQSSPSLSQAQRMRELDQKGMLNGDVIDGIMLEEKKEETKVIISSQELSQYFGKDKTPREMKDQIIKLLDEWKGRQPELSKPEKKQEQEK